LCFKASPRPPNFCKDVSKRSAACFTTLSASSAGELATLGSQEQTKGLDLVAFSCGHVFQRTDFYEVTLLEGYLNTNLTKLQHDFNITPTLLHHYPTTLHTTSTLLEVDFETSITIL
jgi:hypothetical protein